jgi:hypothetical protein
MEFRLLGPVEVSVEDQVLEVGHRSSGWWWRPWPSTPGDR